MQELSGSLRSERDRLSAILSSLGDGLCALDPEGRLLFINPKGEQLLGWRQEELVGRDLLAMVAVSCTDSGRGDHNASLPALVGTGRTYRIAVGLGVNGRGIERRAAAILNDYPQQIGTETAAGRAGVRAAVAAPMLHEGRLMGALSVNTYDSARKFNDEDAEVLELLSGIGS